MWGDGCPFFLICLVVRHAASDPAPRKHSVHDPGITSPSPFSPRSPARPRAKGSRCCRCTSQKSQAPTHRARRRRSKGMSSPKGTAEIEAFADAANPARAEDPHRLSGAADLGAGRRRWSVYVTLWRYRQKPEFDKAMYELGKRAPGTCTE